VTIHAAGILIVATDGKALFVKRGLGGDAPGLWCFPGGLLGTPLHLGRGARYRCCEEIDEGQGRTHVWASTEGNDSAQEEKCLTTAPLVATSSLRLLRVKARKDEES